MEPRRCALERIAELPDDAAVYLVRLGAGEPYVGRTKRLRSKLERLLAPAEGKRLSLAGRATGVEWIPVFSDFEARWVQYEVLRREFPREYRRKLRLRPPPVIRIGWANPYPRAAVTRRFGRGTRASYYGPFRSRKEAEDSLYGVLSLFKVRRCWEDLKPAPDHPGCVYGEMKLCAAPCQLKISAGEYAEEVRRMEAFIAGGGASAMEPLERERERATENLQFETAKSLHEEWLRFKAGAAGIPEHVRRLDRWDAVLLQRGSRKDALRLFRVRAGALHDCGEADVGEAKTKGLKDVAELVRVRTEAPEAELASVREQGEHLALLQKWLYRNPARREGELVQADYDGVISARRIANAAMRVVGA